VASIHTTCWGMLNQPDNQKLARRETMVGETCQRLWPSQEDTSRGKPPRQGGACDCIRNQGGLLARSATQASATRTRGAHERV